MLTSLPEACTTKLDRLLLPVHRWIWADAGRRVRKLLRFSQVEGDGGRDILRAAEVTPDPLLRRLYLAHAIDELRHSELFLRRGSALLHALPPHLKPGMELTGHGPGEHGLDDLNIEDEQDEALLAFLHVAEKSAAGRFAVYRDIVKDDPQTQAVFEEILRDEVFHMNYTYTQLSRISPEYKRRVWRARASRLGNRYLRAAAALAGLLGEALLTIQYFLLLPPFAWLAKRAERKEPRGWMAVPQDQKDSLESQF